MLLSCKRIKLLLSKKRCFSIEAFPDNNLGETFLKRKIGLTLDEQANLKKLTPESVQNPHTLVVSVIGLPNSGKSTFVNSINKWRISSVSKKVHTTRKNILSTFNQGNTQIVLLDTPGLVSKSHCSKHGLEEEMATCPFDATSQADMIAVVVDAFNPWTRNYLDPITLLHLQQNASKPSILILNKVDLVKSKAILLEVMRTITGAKCDDQNIPFTTDKSQTQTLKEASLGNSLNQIHAQGSDVMKNVRKLEEDRLAEKLKKYETREKHSIDLPHSPINSLVYKNYGIDPSEPTSHQDVIPLFTPADTDRDKHKIRTRNTWSLFKEVFMVSASNNDGIDDIRNYFISNAIPKPWIYNSSFVTDQMPEQIIKDTIREELLNEFQFQIPYVLDVVLDEYFVDEYGLCRIKASILCPQSNLVKIIIGPKGEKVKRISQSVSQNLMNTFRADLYLSLAVKYRPSRVK